MQQKYYVVIWHCSGNRHCHFCFSATKIELYVGDVSVAVDDRLPALSQARFTRLGYVYLCWIFVSVRMFYCSCV